MKFINEKLPDSNYDSDKDVKKIAEKARHDHVSSRPKRSHPKVNKQFGAHAHPPINSLDEIQEEN